MKHRCVIVEDQTMVLQLLAGMVRHAPGVDLVGTFSKAKEAIDFCGQRETDLLLLDLQLADGSGIDVLRAAKIKNPKVNAIILSGHASQFVCPKDFHSSVRAVVDKTQAYGSLQKEIADIVQSKGEGSSHLDPKKLLTGREFEVFSLVGRGKMSKEIAAYLKISLRTVETHRKAICRKMQVSGPELIRHASLYLNTQLAH